MSKYLTPELDRKYAQMWIDTNSWKLPDVFVASYKFDKLNEKELSIATGAMWQVFNMLARDGLISRKELRAAHDRVLGKKGHSKIAEGYHDE